jgi:homeobox protein cut-like
MKIDINLSSLQKDLDAQGLEILDNQQQSLASRKKLAEQTRGKTPCWILSCRIQKGFRRTKADRVQKLAQGYCIDFDGLGYQNEIDNITKRSKLAETAFLNLYKKIAEAPDPSPLISTVVVNSDFLN